MFKFQDKILAEDRSIKYHINYKDKRVSFRQFIDLLQSDNDFRSFFIELLSNVPFDAYHWETPPVTKATTEQPFQFVVTNSPGIDLAPDVGPFAQYFGEDDQVSIFDNLGGDAKLIAPAPTHPEKNYSHIGVFTEQAPLEQQKTLWQRVGQVTEAELSDQPIWLNTAGGGVAWLHVRFDSAPKYYRHRPYRYFN
ncbi:hypothetical protein LX73_0489 [Fodinibius salinus]|uniref:Uncharacterized protein n=1 Tax=Fodinibius salinus TaxID=860790 RepID=A0A5D3YQD9_9BACT|nr:hypothetical protein [Fodinibius salinus]TYP95193.1 hypothetical protein LX73_0489 [Fodinibius salinus]